MIVVHGLVTVGGQVALWAESQPADGVCRCSAPAASGRTASDRTASDQDGRGSADRVRTHPFAVLPAIDGTVETATLLLPSRGRAPLASPALDVRCECVGPVDTRPWTVAVVLPEPGTELEMLVAPGSTAGDSVGHLADVLAFARDLTRRGRFVPTVVDGPQARWRAYIGGEDLQRFEDLRRALPGVALVGGGWSADMAVRALCNGEVDRLARTRLVGPLVPRRLPSARTTGASSTSTSPAIAPPAGDGGWASRAVSRDSDTAASNWPSPPLPGANGLAGELPAHSERRRADASMPSASMPSATVPSASMPGASAPGGTKPGVTGTSAATTGRRVGVAVGDVVRAWLGGLAGPDAHFDADAGEVRKLRERLDQWYASGAPAPVRTCFRLTFIEEGERDDEPAGWLLEFLLQPVADPSVLIPADLIWSDVDTPLYAWIDDPQEVLLADLGRASRLYPDLVEALYGRHPEQMFLDTAGAHRFLSHAPMLVEAGFGVLLPARWQQRTDLGLSLTVHSRQTTTAVLRDHTASLDAIVDYRWGLALGAEVLSQEDLVELARAKVPLVRLRGRWTYLDEAQVAAGLAFLARGGTGQMSAGEAMRLARLFPRQPLPVTEVDGTGWLADLLSGRVGERLALIDPPASLVATLRPYQLRGLAWLAFLDGLGVGALLADDMGLGKTVQLLALEALSRERGPRPPTLIVCPMSVLGNWQREIERFTPSLKVTLFHGSERGLDPAADLVLTTYNLVTRDIDLLSQTQWDRVVLDEAQHVKNSASATARAARLLPARHRVALTGTPVENRLVELWSIMDFLNPGVLGPAGTFRSRYSVPVERHQDEDAASRLRRVVRPFVLRRLKTDPAVISDLPEKFERIQWCNLTAEQATLYQAVVDDMVGKLDEGRTSNQRKGLVLAAMTKLKQVCNHPAQLLGDGSALPGRSGKIDRLEEILANALADGDRALVFTQFARLGHMLVPHLSRQLGMDVAFLHGGTPKGARDAMVERFSTSDGPAVLLLSLKAGGTGLNLTAANHVVHVDRWWNPATEAQATDRAFRIGQRRDVQVHKFICAGTIEERIDRMISEKTNLAQVAVGSGESWLTNLSTNDLLDLVALDPAALESGALDG